MPDNVTLAPVWPALRAMIPTVVPEAGGLDARGWCEVRGIMEDALASRPGSLARRVRVLVRLLHWLPLLRHGRRFDALDAGRRSRFLERVQGSRLRLLRRGFWGLRTLVLMGYYGRASAAAGIGYRADARGWERRR